jgi:hypothetical protein
MTLPILGIAKQRIADLYGALLDDRYPSTDEAQSLRLDIPCDASSVNDKGTPRPPAI